MDTPHVFIRDALAAHRRPAAVRARDRSLPFVLVGLSLAAVPPLGRALAVQVAASRTAAVLPPDAVVGAAVLAAGLLAALWYAATGVGLILAGLTRRDLGVSRWGAPVARRLALGAGLGLLAFTPAHADVPDDLSWGAVATLDPADLAAPTPPPTAAEPPIVAQVAVLATVPAVVTVGTGPATHVVSVGECLWDIAEARLVDPTTARIAESVAEWVEANPSLAANPDLIHPGDVLAVPHGAQR